MTILLTDKIKDDPLALAIHTVTKVMAVDYATQYKKAFDNREAESLCMRRMYKKLIGVDPRHIIEAYENIAEIDTRFMPSVAEIIKEAQRLNRNRQAAAEKLVAIESNQNAITTHKPYKKCIPLELLANAKEIADKKAKSKDDDWATRKAETLKNHNAVLNLHSSSIRKHYVSDDHLCSVRGCKKSGSTTGSVRGSESWFCGEHYRMVC